jgi:hypothetical protein
MIDGWCTPWLEMVDGWCTPWLEMVDGCCTPWLEKVVGWCPDGWKWFLALILMVRDGRYGCVLMFGNGSWLLSRRLEMAEGWCPDD